jgi:hypothetical protein
LPTLILFIKTPIAGWAAVKKIDKKGNKIEKAMCVPVWSLPAHRPWKSGCRLPGRVLTFYFIDQK